VKNTRKIGKKDMVLNDATPAIAVDAETYKVTADGVHLTCAPSSVLPMAQVPPWPPAPGHHACDHSPSSTSLPGESRRTHHTPFPPSLWPTQRYFLF